MERHFHDIVSGRRRGVGWDVVRGGLGLLSRPYGLAVARRNRAFDRGKGAVSLGRPTVSVGNLTVGGTGKTPVVAWLCGRLLDANERPAVLSRGYKASPGELSDETLLLRSLLGESVGFASHPRRVEAAKRALIDRPETTCFVLDDGFQHRSAARDFDLVLVDATRPFGHNRLLPAGLLREPVTSLRRASAVLVTRADLGDAEAVRQRVAAVADLSTFTSRFTLDVAAVAGRPTVAACGIGNPAAFFDALLAAGMDVRECLIFPDHHAFSVADARRIVAATPSGGVAVVTGKDWVKLRDVWPPDAPVVVAGQATVVDDAAGLVSLVLDAIRRARTPPASHSSTPAAVTPMLTHIE